MYPSRLYRGSSARAGRIDEANALLDWWDPTSWYRVGRKCRRSDILITQYIHPFHAPAIGTVLRAAEPTPSVVVVHNVDPHEGFPFQRSLARWAVRPATAAVTHSHHVSEALASLLPHLPVAVVPHPPNIEVSAEAPPERPPLRLLFLGHIRSYKGLDLCIEALGRCVRRGMDVILTVAGEFWNELEQYVNLVSHEGLDGRVEIIPRYITSQEVRELLCEHHALILPYRSATQSGLAPLAFAAGRPVVATRVGGLIEQVDDDITGVLAATNDAVGLADAITRLAESYDSLQMGAKHGFGSWEDVAGAITAIGKAT